MAGGGDVRIIGGSKRVKDGVADVSQRALHVRSAPALPGGEPSLRLQGVEVQTGSLLGVRPQRVPIQEYGGNDRPNFYNLILGAFDIPSTVILDNVSAVSAGMNSALGLFGSPGTMRNGPDKATTPVEAVALTTLNNVTGSVNGPTINVNTARFLTLFLSISTSAGTPGSVQVIPQFSPDAGTTFFDYAVDQWVNFVVAQAQTPVLLCVPLNYVVTRDFRLRMVGIGVDAANTFDVQAFVDSGT